jgi:LysM repeat protein
VRRVKFTGNFGQVFFAGLYDGAKFVEIDKGGVTMSANPQLSRSGILTHEVQPGETMIAIAKQHGVTLKALQSANPQIKNVNLILVGEVLTVPSSLESRLVPEPAATPVTFPPPAVADDSPSFARMDKRGKTKKINPVFRQRLAMLADALGQLGMQTLITDGLRTFAEQDALFEQGRTKPGPKVTNAKGGLSNHNYGLAVDMYPVINDKVFTDVPRGASVEFRRLFHAIQDAAGEEAERLGLFWGARFSGIVDTPHIQLLAESDMRPAECLRIFNQNGGNSEDSSTDILELLAPVWAEAERRVKPLG